ncbi:MAG: hypothetical protein OXK77_15685 [Gemmatimonadota bacterium]|nr:hypothetical protein [Gammaproteobacteria bacterium]MDE2784395.1 hypothetical protein [Gemmatimonadota bacterium]
MPKLTRTAKTTTRPRFLPPLLLTALLPACGETGGGAADGTAGTLDGPDVIVNAVTEEVFTVGSIAGDDWDTFGNVRSVDFDAQGNLHIFDSQADHILVVGPDGSLIRTVGGQGEGPGEFGNATTAIVARDGSYTVMGFTTIDLLESDGEFVRRITLDPFTTGMVMASMALPDGRLLAGQILRLGGDEEETENDGRPIHIFPLDGTEPELLYTAWELPEEDEDESSMESTSGGVRMRFAAGRAFEPRLQYDLLTDGRLALIDSIGYRVKLIGLDGTVTGTIERPIAPLPVDDAIMEAERERYREREASEVVSSGGVNVQVEREGVEGRTFAAELPVLYDLDVDWDDRIWLERWGPTGDDDGPTDIVTPAGDYIGTLSPDGLRTPDAFGPDGLLAYIELDEMEVPTVRVVRLVALEPEQ